MSTTPLFGYTPVDVKKLQITSLCLVLLLVWLGGCSPQPVSKTSTVPPTVPLTARSEEHSTPQAPSAPTISPTIQPTVFLSSDAVPEMDRAIFRAGLITAAQESLDRLPGASEYNIVVSISDDFMTLSGHERVRYTNHENTPLDKVYFQLFPNISGGKTTIAVLEVDGQVVTPTYEYADSAIGVALLEVLQPGDDVVIDIDFEVDIAQTMAGNYGLFGYFDGVLVLDEFYPVIPVYDDEGWNVQVPPPNGDLTYFDASFYVVRVTAPADLIVVASGTETEREHTGDRQTLTFVAGPARDFYLAASAKFTVVSEQVGQTKVNSYAFRERKAGARLALTHAVAALQSFNARFGDYPYTELDIVSTPMQALGIEYPGIVGITLQTYDLDATVAGLPARVMLETVVAHEVAHQWFYSVVGNDQIDEPWLDEAVAQYATGLYYLDVQGEAASKSYRQSWNDRWQRVDRATIPIGLPSGAYEEREYSPIVYGRGPLFIAALAEQMGQETFDAFLRDYYQSHVWSIGTGDAFQHLAEQHCRCDLSVLFATWVYAE